MPIELHTIVSKAVECIHKKEKIILCIPTFCNNKGIVESRYTKFHFLAEVQASEMTEDLSKNMPNHRQTCVMYLEKNDLINNYINALVKRKDASYWRIAQILEDFPTWQKVKLYKEKAINTI